MGGVPPDAERNGGACSATHRGHPVEVRLAIRRGTVAEHPPSGGAMTREPAAPALYWRQIVRAGMPRITGDDEEFRAYIEHQLPGSTGLERYLLALGLLTFGLLDPRCTVGRRHHRGQRTRSASSGQGARARRRRPAPDGRGRTCRPGSHSSVARAEPAIAHVGPLGRSLSTHPGIEPRLGLQAQGALRSRGRDGNGTSIPTPQDLPVPSRPP